MDAVRKLVSGVLVGASIGGLVVGGAGSAAAAPASVATQKPAAYAAGPALVLAAKSKVRATVTNADGGVYWRSKPQWKSAIKKTGFGVYNGDVVELKCWMRGGTVPDMNNNPLWYRAKVVSGRGKGKGLVNDHFLATAEDKPDIVQAGVSPCAGADSAGKDPEPDRPNKDTDDSDEQPQREAARPEGSSPKPARKDTRDACMRLYPNPVQRTKKITGGTETNYDRTASLYQVCEGFGAPDNKPMPPAMKCAVIAALATYAGPVASKGVDQACDAVSVASDLASESWWTTVGNYGKGEACGYWSDLFAQGAGIVIAGASAGTGPGAAVIGVRSYKALAAGLKLACAGIFDGGASTLGYNLEASHETNVMGDIVNHGKCLRSRTRLGIISWSAADC